MISSINNNPPVAQTKIAEQAKTAATATAAATNKPATDTKTAAANQPKITIPKDELILSKDSGIQKTGNYGKPDMQRIEALKRQADEALRPLKDMVKELLGQQGIAFKEANFESNKDKMVDISPEMRAEAQKNIAEDGEYGVEKTSTRIVDFAKALAGDDPAKIETLRNAIKKGYEEAGKAFGGELPEISQKTLDATMKKLDEWQNPTT